MPQVTVAAINGWCLGGGLALLNGHDLAVSCESAMFGMPEVIRGSYGAVATSTLFHSGIPIKKAFYIQLTGRNLTAAEAERIGLVSQVVPDNQLIPYVEQLAKELGSRNGATLESAKIAAYMEKDLDFDTALKTDDLVSHRMRYYTNPLSDVEGYLHSQKGGGTHGLRQTGGSEEVGLRRRRNRCFTESTLRSFTSFRMTSEGFSMTRDYSMDRASLSP